MACDANIRWKRQVLYVPMVSWLNTSSALSVPVSGGPLGGRAFTTITATYEGGYILPIDLDPNFEIGFRVMATAATALTDLSTVTYVMLAAFRALHNTAVAAAAAGALDTVIGAKTVTAGAGITHLSNRGVKNAGFLTRAQVLAGAYMQWSISLTDAGAATIANGVVLHGLLMDYVPMRTKPPHVTRQIGMQVSDIFA